MFPFNESDKALGKTIDFHHFITESLQSAFLLQSEKQSKVKLVIFIILSQNLFNLLSFLKMRNKVR